MAPMVGALSRRSMAAMKPLSSYFPAFARAMERPWSAADPGGNVVMVVAENRLLSESFLERLQRCSPPATEALYYSDFRGTLPLRDALARFMSRHITDAPVDATQLALSNGVGTTLDHLFHCLCDEADGVMLPAPLYPTFLNDLTVRCRLRPTIVPTDAAHDYFPTVRQLETAAQAAAEGRWGRFPRVLLLTNPSNPLGTVIDPAAYTDAIRWVRPCPPPAPALLPPRPPNLSHSRSAAERSAPRPQAVERGMHVVSDEIYACSIFGDDLPPFVSGWDVADQLASAGVTRSSVSDPEGKWGRGLMPSQKDGQGHATADPRQQVHVVYGLAKDFGVSGLRIGALASRHEELLAAHSNLGYLAMVPGPVQAAVAEILEDEAWVDEFLRQNNAALRASYGRLTAALDAAGVPYLPGGASMFLWVDLRRALPADPSWSDERELFDSMCEAGIVLTPGKDCEASEPGFFRACWAASPPEAHETAVHRIASFLPRR